MTRNLKTPLAAQDPNILSKQYFICTAFLSQLRNYCKTYIDRLTAD